jgi:16S rRNA (adenine1518-N6/adenine1519-N6)-dimethyltransferase
MSHKQIQRISAKRKFGQNFLVSKSMQDKIALSWKVFLSEYSKSEVVEIGPGMGDLTNHLLKLDRKITALEVDPEAIEYLHTQFTKTKKLKVIETDALKEFARATSDILPKDFVLVSNLPFNVGSRILVEMGINYPQCPFSVILQKEVAKKILSSSDLTLFSAWINLIWETKYQFDISRSCFDPEPNVDCGLISAVPKQLPIWMETPQQRKKALTILKKLFAFPSKTLLNNLKGIISQREQISDFFAQTGLPLTVRLSNDNYIEILAHLIKGNYV